MSTIARDMTRGNPVKHILTFSLPLMLGSVLQILYTMVDAAVVGQALGVQALASLGAADWPNWLVLSLCIGFTQGFAILTAQYYGAQDYANLKKAISMSVLLSGALAVIITTAGLFCVRPLLSALKTPGEILPSAAGYLSILYSGIPVVMFYNLFASILRSLGNGRAPLIAMIIASLINIGLDLLFVLVFKWGIAGAALATIIAQAFSMLFCLAVLLRASDFRPEKKFWRPDFAFMGRLMRLGLPVALQNGIIGIGGIVVQSVVNSFGVSFVAGFTSTNKLYGLLEMAAISYGYALTTYTGQNIGARRYLRLRRGVRSGTFLAIATSVGVSVIVYILAPHLLSLFISASAAEAEYVMNVAVTYLRLMCTLLFILYLLHVYRCTLQGMGDTIIPMVSGILELVMRVAAVLILPQFIGEYGIYLGEILAWAGAVLVLMPACLLKIRKLPGTDA